MKFGNRKTPLYCASIDSQASAASSEALSVLLKELDSAVYKPDSDSSDIAPGSPLGEEMLRTVGRVNKTRILDSWVACQSYLSQAELRSRFHQPSPSFGMSESDRSFSDATTRSDVSSHTTLSRGRTGPVNNKAQSKPAPEKQGSFSFLRSSRHTQAGGTGCAGTRYDSFPVPMILDIEHFGFQTPVFQHDVWERLNSAWRSSLHIPGPKIRKKPPS